MLSWIKSKNAWEKQIRFTDICTGSDAVEVLFPWFLPMLESKHLCEKFNGKTVVIANQEMQETLFSQMNNYPELAGCPWPKCVAWTGVSDEANEGHFVDINEGKPLEFKPWSPGEPSGKREENCGIAYKLAPFWYDAPCENGYFSFCRVEETARLHLRGRDCGSLLAAGAQRRSMDLLCHSYLLFHLAVGDVQGVAKKLISYS